MCTNIEAYTVLVWVNPYYMTGIQGFPWKVPLIHKSMFPFYLSTVDIFLGVIRFLTDKIYLKPIIMIYMIYSYFDYSLCGCKL